jgi:triacylglycerol lipase
MPFVAHFKSEPNALERSKFMSIHASIIKRGIFLAAATFQALQQFENNGKLVLPKGFKLITSLGGGDFPLIGYIMESKNKIIVAFRGTEDLSDVLQDLDFFQSNFPFIPSGGKVSRGFLNVYKSIRAQIFNALQNASSQKTIFITGHSLGGALATLSALDVAVNSKFRQPIVFTFGSPRVGNPQFVSTFNKTLNNSVRIVNVNDIVPLLPPKNISLPFFKISYRHVQKKFPISFQFINPLDNHEIRNYFTALCGLNSNFCAKMCKNNPNFCPSTNSTRVLKRYDKLKGKA